MVIKVGVVGLGKMGRLHLRNCRFIRDAKVVAAADASKRSLLFANDMGIKQLSQDYNEILKSPDLTAIIIALPNFLHLESICAAAEAGKDIFVEKPLATSVVECEKIIDAVKKNGVKLMVGHNYRFIDCVEKLKAEYDKGTVGDVELATLELCVNGPFAPSLEPTPVAEWYFSKDQIGMGCLDSGYHLIDLFQWFFGDPTLLYANLGHRYLLPYEDSSMVILKSKKGSTKGVLNVGWFSKAIFPKFDFRIILHGTTGFASTEQYTPRNLYVHATKEAVSNIARKILGMEIQPLTYTYFYASYFKELQGFFESLKNETEPPVTMESALETIKIIQQIYENKEGTGF